MYKITDMPCTRKDINIGNSNLVITVLYMYLRITDHPNIMISFPNLKSLLKIQTAKDFGEIFLAAL